MKASRSQTKAKRKPKRKPKKQSSQPRAPLPRFAQHRRKSGAPMAVLHTTLRERRGPFRNLIEIPGMEGRILKRVEIYTAIGHHSLTLDFQDSTSLTLLLDPCFFISAELSDISSGSERLLKRWPTIKSTTEHN